MVYLHVPTMFVQCLKPELHEMHVVRVLYERCMRSEVHPWITWANVSQLTAVERRAERGERSLLNVEGDELHTRMSYTGSYTWLPLFATKKYLLSLDRKSVV